MCIAILKPKGKSLSEKYLEESFRVNSDGAGFGFYDNNKPRIFKPYFSWKDFISDWRFARKKYDLDSRDVVLHFRIATHGGLTEENTHPFLSEKGTIVAHNGVISGLGDSLSKGYVNKTGKGWTEVGSGKSDTVEFIEKYINKLPTEFWKSSVLKSLVEDRITYSKLVILSPRGWGLLNESNGHWDSGIWYSNLSYRPVVKTKYENKYSDHWNGKNSEYSVFQNYEGLAEVYFSQIGAKGLDFPKGRVTVEFLKKTTDNLNYSRKIRIGKSYHTIYFSDVYSITPIEEKEETETKVILLRKPVVDIPSGEVCSCGKPIYLGEYLFGYDTCVDCMDEETYQEYKDLALPQKAWIEAQSYTLFH